MQKSLNISEVSRCLLCKDAPCNEGCYKGINIAKIIKSLYFKNTAGAIAELNNDSCIHCDAPCQFKCVLGKTNSSVNIKSIL